jgi:hypothetical protein
MELVLYMYLQFCYASERLFVARHPYYSAHKFAFDFLVDWAIG